MNPNLLCWNHHKRGHQPGHVYAFIRDVDGAIKLGYSIDPDTRIRQVRSFRRNGNVSKVITESVCCMACAEASLHRMFSDRRLPPSFWTGTEWFSITREEAVDAVVGAF